MATRKTTSKTTKTVSKKTVATKMPVVKSSPKVAIPDLKLKDFILPAIVVIIIVLLGVFKNQFIVAEVNGQPITRLQLISQLEKKDGKTVLDSIVTEKLIQQEADKRKVTVSPTEVNTEIGNITKSVTAQGQNVDDLLAQQGMTRADLNDQVKIQLLLKKMVGGNITVTDKEISDYIAQNKDSIPAGTDPTTMNSQVKQQLEQQKLNDKIQSFVADLQKKAKIDYLLKF